MNPNMNIAVEQDVEMMEDNRDWMEIQKKSMKQSDQNAIQSKAGVIMLSEKDMPLNEDGTMSVFWYDAHEDIKPDGRVEVYLFGKTMGKDNKPKSVALNLSGL